MKTINRMLLIVILTPFSFLQATEKANSDNSTAKESSETKLKNTFSTVENDTIDNQLYHIIKTDNSEYIGNIISDDGREILIKTSNLGKIYIPKSQIKKIEEIEDEKSILRGEYNDAGPFVTRYTFTTNALPLKKGSNYAIINLYGPEAHFAVADNFSVGVMTSWIGSPFVLALKYSIKTNKENVNFSLGTLLGTSSYVNSFKGYGGLHFGNITFGDAKKNMTFAAGYGYISSGNTYYDNGIEQNSSELNSGPVFSIAGITKVGTKASFIFDSMIGVFNSGSTQDVAMLLMPGMRFQTTDKKAFQISLAGVTVFTDNSGTYTFPLPMLSWFYKF